MVFVYKRPELTLRLVNRIKEVNLEFKVAHGELPFSRILLVHDGVRKSEDLPSRQSHRKARELCLDIEKWDSRVAYFPFDDNVGLTRHVYRVVDTLKLDIQKCVIFEEDKAPNVLGIKFLISMSRSKQSFSLLDTLPLNAHPKYEKGSFSTLFTDNGNIMISEELFELAKELLIAKDKYQSEFDRNLFTYLSSFLSGYSLRRAFKYYSNYLSWGLVNVDRGDSLLSYSLILSKSLKNCPTSPLGDNWSDRDTRGKNVNIVPDHRGADCNFSTTEIWGSDICPRCEKQGVSERIELNRIGALKVGLNYRISKYRNSKQKQ